MTRVPLLDILNDRSKLMRLFWLGFWASIAIMVLGLVMIVLDLFG